MTRHVDDPTDLDWDRADIDFELIAEDRAEQRRRPLATHERRHEKWLAGETR